MSTLRSLLLVLLGAGIGLAAYHFLIRQKDVSKSDCPPFKIQSRTPKEDTAYKNYYKAQNQGMKLDSLFFSTPVDTAILSGYVRNFKEEFPGGTYSFAINHSDMTRLAGVSGAIRIYFGMLTPKDPSSGTVILTGVNSDGGDIYIPILGGQFGIDQASPCPTDCPFTLRDAVMDPTSVPTTGPIPANPPLNPNKSMLGRLWDKDPRL